MLLKHTFGTVMVKFHLKSVVEVLKCDLGVIGGVKKESERCCTMERFV